MSQYALELLAQGQAIPLVNGAAFSWEQFPALQPSTPGGPVALVSTDPYDSLRMGLQNLSDTVWTAMTPDGMQQQINPGQTAPLIDGMTLQLGAMNCSVQAASGAAMAQAASSPVSEQPFAQTQQPYYQQAAPPQAPGVWPPAPNPYGDGGAGFNNDSGTGATAVLPAELKGFSGGAFLLNWIWAINMKTYIGLLCLIPYLGFIMAIVLGVKGNEWAWQNRRWASIDEFKTVQKAWSNWGLGIIVISVVLGFAVGLIGGIAARH